MIMSRTSLWPGLAVLAAVFCCAQLAQAQPGNALRVTSIVPSGDDVPPGRQIVLQFDRPVVPIGRMDRDAAELPIEITPALPCQWRWLDPAALACQLGDDSAMAPATAYSLRIEPGLQSRDGATMERSVEHRFVTERPRLQFTRFETWQSPSLPQIRLVFNQTVGVGSVADHVWFETAEGRIDAVIEPAEGDRETPRFLPLPGEAAIVDFGGPQTEETDDQPASMDGEEARRVWIATPERELGIDTHAFLNIEPGLRSAEGPEQGAEERVVVEFDTFPEFRVLGLVCHENNGTQRLIANGEENASPQTAPGGSQPLCGPLQRAGIAFSTPTIASEVRDGVRVVPDLAGGRTDYDPWASAFAFSQLSRPHQRGRQYIVWFPERLQAASDYRVESAEGVPGPADEFGRSLAVPIDIDFATDHRPPDFTIVHNQAVIESGIDSDVPLYVTNLDGASVRYRSLTPDGQRLARNRELVLSDVEDIHYGLPFGVRDMLDGQSGAVYARLSTNPPVPKYEGQSTLFAQVTPFQLHVKLGHFNTLVWVTDLATGEPVEDAEVSVYVDRLVELGTGTRTIGSSMTDNEGVAMLAGTSTLDPDLQLLNSGNCNGPTPDYCDKLFVKVQRGEDMALMPLDWQFEVDAGRVTNYAVFGRSLPRDGHVHAWGTTAQGVYRAGDTIEYKFWVRAQSNETYVPAQTGPYTLEIVDPMGRVVHTTENLELSPYGAWDGEYQLPESAAVGWYVFRLTAGFAELVRQPMRVLVSDFTPSSFSVTTTLNSDSFVAGSPVRAEARAELFSGGPYTDAEARLTATLQSRQFVTDHPLAAGFRFDASGTGQLITLARQEGEVDPAGTIRHEFELPASLGESVVFGTITVDGSVRDDRGRYVSGAARARFLAVDRLVGLRNTQWVYSEDEPAGIEYLVVGTDGAPVAGDEVHIQIERLDTRAARVRGAGNAFLTQYVEEWVPVGNCEGLAGAQAQTCTFTPEAPGRHRAIASIVDTQGRQHRSEMSMWVRGAGQVVWNTGNDDALELVPEATSFEVGDTARYLVQNPFPEALALVTIERYGVLRQWVERFDTSTPVLEFEVEPDYLPGFFLSVLLMSPRVDAPMPATGELDLGKPSFKLGYVEVPVTDPYKTIDVEVRVDEDVYEPRDSVRVRVAARPRNRDDREPIEAAVVVIDEAVLDLVAGGTDYFDPYAGFYGLDGLDVRNYGLLTRLVGRQRIELKGANAGGDGGSALSMRNLFDYVAYWNPSLQLNGRGRGEFEFELPDNLTGWRVLVLATTATDRMGLGQGEFRVNLDTEIRPVMPNQISEADRFMAGFSILNRTERDRDVEVSIRAAGDVEGMPQLVETISLSAFERRSVFVPVKASMLPVTRDVVRGAVVFEVSAGDASDTDALSHEVPVLKSRTLQTAASYGTTDGPNMREALLVPEAIHTDAGEISVEFAPSVLGNLEGAFRFMRDFGYTSWEQRLSRAVMAASFVDLAQYLDSSIYWPESVRLPDSTLSSAAGFQAPNGGMSYFYAADEYVSPYLSAYTALAFNWLRDAGHEIPEAVESRLHDYLGDLLRRDVMPSFYDRGMSSTVRAVALAALARHGRLDRSDIERYREHVAYMSLFGKAHFLMAVQEVGALESIAMEVRDTIMAASVRGAGKLSFNETLDDGFYRILSTPMRSNCSVLSAFASSGAFNEPDGLFEMVRAITQTRENRAHWENTQENVFCMQALVDYARRYEQSEPDFVATASVDTAVLGTAEFAGFRDAPASFSRPLGPEDPGRSTELEIEYEGEGRLYYAARMSYSPIEPAGIAVNAGIDVRRELSVQRDGQWVLLDDEASIRRGELVRVDLFLSLPTARHFVVVDDPVPGGLEPVNRDLANTSITDAQAGEFVRSGGSWWFQYSDWRLYNVTRYSFHHQEMRHDAVRFYSDYLPPGNYNLSYTAQAIAEGEFSMRPVHAEEMYDPDVYGQGLSGQLQVLQP